MELHKDLHIIPKPSKITWEEITQLIHLGYHIRERENLLFKGVSQSVEETIERVGNGVCLVALYNNKLVGTITYQIYDSDEINKRKWYQRGKCVTIFQFAVHPEYKRLGIGKNLEDVVIKIAQKENVNYCIIDTASKATWLLTWYKNIEYVKIGYVSHIGTNYYSIVMAKRINGIPFNNLYRLSRYYFSKILCIALKNNYGKVRRYLIPALNVKKHFFNKINL